MDENTETALVTTEPQPVVTESESDKACDAVSHLLGNGRKSTLAYDRKALATIGRHALQQDRTPTLLGQILVANERMLKSREFMMAMAEKTELICSEKQGPDDLRRQILAVVAIQDKNINNLFEQERRVRDTGAPPLAKSKKRPPQIAIQAQNVQVNTKG